MSNPLKNQVENTKNVNKIQ